MTTYDGEQRERDLSREPDDRDSDDEALPVEDTYDTYTTEEPPEAETVGEVDTATVDLDDEGRPVDEARDDYGGGDEPETVDLDDETTEADGADDEPETVDLDDEARGADVGDDVPDTVDLDDEARDDYVGGDVPDTVDLDDEARDADGGDEPDTVDLDDEDRMDDETTEADVAELDAAEGDDGVGAAGEVEPVEEPAGYAGESVDEPVGYADETPAEEAAAVLAEVGRPSLAEGDHESRWKDIQAEFVDDPQRAMADAETLVADVLDDLTRTLSGERDALTAQWRDSEDPSTEDLRVTLRSYHVFLQRLVAT